MRAPRQRAPAVGSPSLGVPSWPDEPWIKQYSLTTPAWSALPWEARALFVLLWGKVDAAGVLQLELLPHHDGVAIALGEGSQGAAIRPCLDQLAAGDWLALGDHHLVIPHFAAAQANPHWLPTMLRAPAPPGWSRDAYPEVYARDGASCRYCGGTDTLQIDHVIPRSQGGGDGADNLVVACRPDNQRKSGRTPEQAGMVLLPVPGGG